MEAKDFDRASAPVDGIVLAAGRSTRMGEPKPLLRAGPDTFIERAVHTLRKGGCRLVVAVVNEAADWTARLADATGALIVLNPAAESEQIDSLRLALERVPGDAAAVAVLPVDHPAVSADTVSRLVDAYRRSRARIVRPVAAGAPGHPTIFDRALFEELRGELPNGARTVVEADGSRRLDVNVDDEGTALDVNTPADYRRLLS